MTTVRILNNITNRDATVNVPLPLSEVTERLRKLIDPGDFDDIRGCVTSAYARVVGNSVTVILFGCGSEEASAEVNRIKTGLLQKGKVTT